MPNLFSRLEMQPDDPVLRQLAEYRQDTRPDKLDIGVGVYKDDHGATPVMRAVTAAEERIAAAAPSKAYEGIRGNEAFCERVLDLVCGPESKARKEGRLWAATTIGGSGALHLGMEFARVTLGAPRLWLPSQTWANHYNLVEPLHYDLRTFPYEADGNGVVDFSKALEGLEGARPGDVVLFQGPCHNPTGCDLSYDNWQQLAAFVAEREVLPLIDIAYHGLADGLEEDVKGVRYFLDHVSEAMITYSFSKSFGIYRDRTGALIVQAMSTDEAKAAGSNLLSIALTEYFMPSGHGPSVVDTVLGDPDLHKMWSEELDEMRRTVNERRVALANALVAATGSNELSGIAKHKGMFSTLPLDPEKLEKLKQEHGIYIPPSGRINIAAIPSDRVEEVAQHIAAAMDQPA